MDLNPKMMSTGTRRTGLRKILMFLSFTTILATLVVIVTTGSVCLILGVGTPRRIVDISIGLMGLAGIVFLAGVLSGAWERLPLEAQEEKKKVSLSPLKC